MNKLSPFTQKQIDYLRKTQKSWFNVAEGGKRGGKNVIQTLAFCMALESHPDKIHLIAGVTQANARLNIIDCNGFGMSNYFKGRCQEGKYKDRSCLYIKTPKGEKIVLVSGGGKNGEEKKIQGNSYGMAYITEANNCHKNFINEVFDRTLTSKSRKIFHDLNPKDEQHWYYTDVLNIHFKKQVVNNNYGYNYGHFTIADNLSIDNKSLKALLNTYEKDSLWFCRDILGQRKSAEGIIFPEFANNPAPHIVKTINIPKYFRWCEVGFDIGGNASAYALTCTAYGYDNIYYVLKSKKIQANELNMADIIKLVNDFCNKIEQQYNITPNSINCDHIAVIVNSLNDNTKYNAELCYKPALEDRPFIMSQLLASYRIKFVENETIDLINELKQLVFDMKSDKPIPCDDGTMQIDTWDSWVYSVGAHWNYLDV